MAIGDTYCACGCGKKLSFSRKDRIPKYIRGHYSKTPEAKKELSKMRMGDKNPFYGKRHSEKTKQLISRPNETNPMFGKRGKDAPMYGKTKELSPIWKGGSVAYYRKKSRKIMGLLLHDKRIVHHMDGDITNNEKENLLIIDNSSEHMRLHWLQRRGIDKVIT